LGKTWVTVRTQYQIVTISALKDFILFGTDQNPNGVLRIRRVNKFTIPKTEVAYQIDNVTMLQC